VAHHHRRTGACIIISFGHGVAGTGWIPGWILLESVLDMLAEFLYKICIGSLDLNSLKFTEFPENSGF